MENTLSQQLWLVRTTMNELLGPMPRETLIQEIRSGRFSAQDEVCSANGYWIYLDERDEVNRQLGIELPKGGRGPHEEEITDTETMTTEMQVRPSQAFSEANLSSLEELEKGGEGSTKMFNTRTTRLEPRQNVISNFTSSNTQGSPAPIVVDRRIQNDPMKPLILGSVEQPSFWRYVTAALIVLSGVLVAWVIRVLQSAK